MCTKGKGARAELYLPAWMLPVIEAALGGPLQRVWGAELLPFIFCRRRLGKGWEWLCFQRHVREQQGRGRSVESRGCPHTAAQLPRATAQDGGPGSVTAPSMMQPGQGLQNSVLLQLFYNSTSVRNMNFSGN